MAVVGGQDADAVEAGDICRHASLGGRLALDGHEQFLSSSGFPGAFPRQGRSSPWSVARSGSTGRHLLLGWPSTYPARLLMTMTMKNTNTISLTITVAAVKSRYRPGEAGAARRPVC